MTDLRSLMTLVENAQTLADDLDRVIAAAEAAGVTLRARAYSSRGIELDYIQRKSGEKGTGAKVMRALCALADARRATIKTYVMGFEPKLMDFYESFGFEQDPKGNDEAMLRRLPRR